MDWRLLIVRYAMLNVLFISALIVVTCGTAVEPKPPPELTATPTPSPPPFETYMVDIPSGAVRHKSYVVTSDHLSLGSYCLEYQVELVEGIAGNKYGLETFISLPTGEKKRKVTLNYVNSPIRGIVHADTPGKYGIVLDNSEPLEPDQAIPIPLDVVYSGDYLDILKARNAVLA